ncbi:MAG: hypothetical protein R3B96_06095 [Pirellulaceae bacterium]
MRPSISLEMRVKQPTACRIDLVISDQDVDVAKANAFGQLNLGHRINANNRFDAPAP